MDDEPSTTEGTHTRPDSPVTDVSAPLPGIRSGDPTVNPSPRHEKSPEVVFARRRATLILCLAAAALLALTALVDGVPQLADAGTPRTRLLTTLSTVAVLITLLVARRGASLDAYRKEYLLAALPATIAGVLAVDPVYALVTVGLPARRAMIAATCAVVATVLLLAAAVRSPGRIWWLSHPIARARGDIGARTLAVVLATALVGWGLGTALHRVAIDATATSAPEQATHLPVTAVAWRHSLPARRYTAVSTKSGLAILTGNHLRVLDGATGREFWHRFPRYADDDYREAALIGSPDGRHLAILETTWPTGSNAVMQLTVLTDQGHVLRSSIGPSDVALTDAGVVTIEGSRAVERDWRGRTMWSRPLVEDCGVLETLTHRTVLLVEGCSSKVLTQIDDQGRAIAQTLSAAWDDPPMAHAPDYSSTVFDLDPLRPFETGMDYITATLMFDDHGTRDLAACHGRAHMSIHDCRPGSDGSLWIEQLGSSASSEAVVDASGHTVSYTPLTDGCRLLPVVGGGVRTCGGSEAFQFPGSPPVSIKGGMYDAQEIFSVGGGWVVVGRMADGSLDLIGLR